MLLIIAARQILFVLSTSAVTRAKPRPSLNPTLVLIVILAIVGVNGPVLACKDCNAVLERSFNEYSAFGKAEFRSEFRMFLENSKYEEIRSYSEKGVSFSVPGLGLPIGLDSNTSKSQYEIIQSSLK